MIQLMYGLRYEDPFPVAVFDGCIPEPQFATLVDSFPQALSGERREAKEGAGKYNKDCLADRHHPDLFQSTMAKIPAWRALYDEIKAGFPEMCNRALGPLGFDVEGRKKSVVFEFSSLPGEGGGLLPHPDNAKKVATAVFYMEKEWDDEWGGAFEVCRHRRGEAVDRAAWDEVDTVFTVPVKPRRVVFMQRTPYSLHGVRPLTSPRPRRSITVNLIAR